MAAIQSGQAPHIVEIGAVARARGDRLFPVASDKSDQAADRSLTQPPQVGRESQLRGRVLRCGRGQATIDGEGGLVLTERAVDVTPDAGETEIVGGGTYW